MRLVSWNVNGIRACLNKGFLDWLAAEQPDVVCLQETRVHPKQLPPELADIADYHATWVPAEKLGYSGVATLSRVAPDAVTVGLDDPQFDAEGRTLITRHGDVTVVNGYFPNGQRDHARVPYKHAYYKRLLQVVQARRAAGERVVVCGDLNTAHHEIDLKNWKANRKTTGFLNEERVWLDAFEAVGLNDAFRRLYPDAEDRYTWWSQRGDVRARNVGWRIDYHFVCDALWPRVKDALIHDQVMGSDHCPIELVLAD